MNYEEWENQLPDSIKQDPLWKFEVYPKALLLADFAWEDCEKIMKDKRGRSVADQLIRSAGSISANIEEGFGRGYGKDYARFLKYALGSARETRGWYYRCKKLLDTKILEYRYHLLDEIIALLVTHVNKQRKWQVNKLQVSKWQVSNYLQPATCNLLYLQLIRRNYGNPILSRTTNHPPQNKRPFAVMPNEIEK